jgi:hypothetical protein
MAIPQNAVVGFRALTVWHGGCIIHRYEREKQMTPTHLERILVGHYIWLATESGGQCADLRGADLRGADLGGADLWGADLRGADLRGADLRFARCCYADIEGADLRGGHLWAADFRWTRLDSTIIKSSRNKRVFSRPTNTHRQLILRGGSI